MLVASEASSSRRAHDRRRLELVPRSREVIGVMNTVSVRRFTRFVIISVPLIMFASPPSARAQGADRPKNSVTLFAATLTGNNWEDFLAPTDIKLRDTYLAGLGYARRITSFFNKLDVEALGQTAVHFGHAHQWEFDAALVGRWTYFPWNDWVRTSLAFGVGPSYETQTPPEEVALHGQSEQWLGFWLAELTLAPPESLWSGVVRIHHRSTAFGLFGKTGGSNWLTLGIRRDF